MNGYATLHWLYRGVDFISIFSSYFATPLQVNRRQIFRLASPKWSPILKPGAHTLWLTRTLIVCWLVGFVFEWPVNNHRRYTTATLCRCYRPMLHTHWHCPSVFQSALTIKPVHVLIFSIRCIDVSSIATGINSLQLFVQKYRTSFMRYRQLTHDSEGKHVYSKFTACLTFKHE
jgi:hypothetical protein